MKTVRLLVVLFVALVVGVPLAKEPLKKHTPLAVIASAVYQDGLRRVGLRSGQIGDPYVAERDLSEIPKSLDRIATTYGNYLQYLDRGRTADHVLEVGPGDNIGVALRFAAAGARQVTILDKFVPLQTTTFHRQLYQDLRGRLRQDEQRRFDEAIDLSASVRPNPARVMYVERGIEEADGLIPPGSVDLVVSNAVLEEVYDTDRMFAAIDRVLAPGGMQIHKIDLSDYGMFSKHGHHPLEFLTVPDPVYRYMVESTGQPNRRLVDYYRKKMRELGYESRVYATWVLGSTRELKPPIEQTSAGTVPLSGATDQIRRIRPRLLERYRQLPDEDLAVQGIMLVARKPAASTPARD